MYTSYQSTH